MQIHRSAQRIHTASGYKLICKILMSWH